MDYEMILMSVRRRIDTERNELQILQAEALKDTNYMRAWSTQVGIAALDQVVAFIDEEEQAEMERQTAATQPAEETIVEEPVVEEPELDIFDDELTWVDDYVESVEDESLASESLDDLIDEEL